MKYECRDPDQSGPDEWEFFLADNEEDAALSYACNFDEQSGEGYEQERVVLVRAVNGQAPPRHFSVRAEMSVTYAATPLRNSETGDSLL